MNTPFTDCSQLAGISQPLMTRSVRRSANRFIDDPACSKPDQKHAAARKQTAITPTRFFSTVVKPPNSTTYRKIRAGERNDEQARPVNEGDERQADSANRLQRDSNQSDPYESLRPSARVREWQPCAVPARPFQASTRRLPRDAAFQAILKSARAPFRCPRRRIPGASRRLLRDIRTPTVREIRPR